MDQAVKNLDSGKRIGAVMTEIRRRIAGRELVPGSRLPSVRAFAKIMHVSASTVVEAYERLAAEGLIRSRPGSGFYVSSSPQPLTLSEIGEFCIDRGLAKWKIPEQIEIVDAIPRNGMGKIEKPALRKRYAESARPE